MNKNMFYSTLRLIFRPILKVLFLYDIKGKENIPSDGRVILCPNHTSMADPLLLSMATKRQIFYMGKAELFKNKIVSSIFKKLGGFPVSRGKGDTSALDKAINILKSDNVLGLFIEGTRSKTGEFLRPKTGVSLIAYEAKTTVIPVCISAKNGGRVRLLKRNSIHIGMPIKFSDLEINDGKGKEFRDASRMIMADIKKLSP